MFLFLTNCHLLFRDFRLILNPRKRLLHPQFKAYAVDGAGNEQIIHVGKYLYSGMGLHSLP